MRILLDTHCWLWSYFEPEKLNARAVTILEDLDHEVFFSIASSWEIAIKYQIGKLPGLPDVPARFLPPQLVADRIAILPIKHSHVLMVATTPRHHYDPFAAPAFSRCNWFQYTNLTISHSIPGLSPAANKVSISTVDQIFSRGWTSKTELTREVNTAETK